MEKKNKHNGVTWLLMLSVFIPCICLTYAVIRFSRMCAVCVCVRACYKAYFYIFLQLLNLVLLLCDVRNLIL